ncbi:hypothetical protein IWQ62_002635 [Dispira parvispora]|uniref:Ubiquitin-like domain-containing protein n=1 Tax=Dispira parvispora TaxID=1520584 RepID=A0A9W8AQX1_9FUNG|nr:hypothetical protein IWQ62_002635 [Dispira parvispora]
MATSNISIVVKSPMWEDSTDTLRLTATLYDTVFSLKRQLQRQNAALPGIQHLKLIYRGKLLNNDDTLENIIKDVEPDGVYIFHLMIPNALGSTSRVTTARGSTATTSSTPALANQASTSVAKPMSPVELRTNATSPAVGTTSGGPDQLGDTTAPVMMSNRHDKQGPVAQDSTMGTRSESDPGLTANPLHIVPLSSPFQYVLVNGMPYLMQLPAPGTTTDLPHGVAASIPGSSLTNWGDNHPPQGYRLPTEAGLPPHPPTTGPVLANAPGRDHAHPAAANNPPARPLIIRHISFVDILNGLWFVLRYSLLVFMLSRSMGVTKAILLVLLGLIVLMVQAGRIRIMNVPANVNPAEFINEQLRNQQPAGEGNGGNPQGGNQANPPPPGEGDQGNPPAAPGRGVLYHTRSLVWSFVSSFIPRQRNNNPPLA